MRYITLFYYTVFTTVFGLIPPEDVVARRVLPTLRAMVAVELSGRGLSEREVAERMGLTQAAVSKYLRGRGRREPAVAGAPAFKALAARLGKGLGGRTMSTAEALGDILAVLRGEEDRGLVCQMHEEEVPSLRGLGCDLCVQRGPSALLADQEVLGDLRGALRVLEASPTFTRLIPSVGSNLARGRKGARTPLDVAAVPGRIFEMRGAVRVPAAPEFGASRHVAEVVLAVASVFPRHLAALNVRAEASTLEAARSLGWGLLRFDAGYEGRGDRIARAVRGQKRPPRALYHEGAFGIEPIMYVVGPSATDVVAQTEALGSRL
ncbi:MAG TPA: thiamine-phosphate synthase family protein [Candidatus Thermoplasmatota archaeon]|nr:thiamine-phosphate synthase family protein [Candidatus Thermoplasmatota archaeon]